MDPESGSKPPPLRDRTKTHLKKWRSEFSRSTTTPAESAPILSPESANFLDFIDYSVLHLDQDSLDANQIFLVNKLSPLINRSAVNPDWLKKRVPLDALESHNIDKFYSFFDSVSHHQDEHINAAVIVHWLKFSDLMKQPLPKEELGMIVDNYLIQLRVIASRATLKKEIIDQMFSELSRISELDLPGLDKQIRQNLTLQTLQFMTLNQHGYETVLNRNDNVINYPEVKDAEIISGLPKNPSAGEILRTIFSLISPYKASLGKSMIGKENLQMLIQAIRNGTELLKHFPPESQIERQIAEQAIAIQLYHADKNAVNRRFLERLSPNSQNAVLDYIGYRANHPLWQDRLEIYKRYANTVDISNPDVKTTQLRVAHATGPDALIATLKLGEYLTLHEVFKGNGCNVLRTRSGHENRMLLLATGTSDDPFPRYGCVQIMTPSGYESHHYGSYAIISKPDLFSRVSITPEDSFGWQELPRTGRDQAAQIRLSRDYTSYVEVQLHGGLRAEDIEAIVITDRYIDPNTYDRITKLAANKGIPVLERHELADYSSRVSSIN